jgi:aspartate/methionine/tyrosine aminotransferase
MSALTRSPGSRRAQLLRPLELAGLMAEARTAGALDIAIGTPPGEPPPVAVEAAVRALRGRHNQYGDAAGFGGLRQMVADRLYRTRGTRIDPDTEVTITSGAIEGLLVSLLACTDPGDEVIVVEPAFEIYSGAVQVAGGCPVPAALDGPDWRLDTQRVREAMTGRTRAIVVNSPQNPTGRVFDRAEVDALLRLCSEHDVICLFDAVYDNFLFDDNEFVSPLDSPVGRGTSVVLGSLSKANQMSGWRLGYCVAPPELTRVLRAVHERTTFGAAAPLQVGAAAAADPSCAAEDFRANRDLMTDRLRGMGFQVTAPEGGWFLLGGTTGLGWASDELATALVREAGVLVAPGTPFFSDRGEGRRWIRTTFVKDPAVTAEALDRLASFLREHRPPRAR